MPFRERLKRALGRAPSEPSTPNDPSDPSSSSAAKKEDKKKKKKKKGDEWEDWPEHIYKPHEMPRPKYRRPPEPAHKENLEAYSWDSNTPPTAADDADRRKSHGSLYSPMGSRLPSRMGSVVSRLIPSRAGSRAPSVVQERDEGEGEGEGQSRSGGSAILERTSTKDSSKSRRRHSSRIYSTSRPGTSADHPPLVEHSSAERSQSDTPRNNNAAADGGELENVQTVTEAGGQQQEEQRRNTVKQSEPFDQDELTRKLTTLTVKQEPPSAVAAAS